MGLNRYTKKQYFFSIVVLAAVLIGLLTIPVSKPGSGYVLAGKQKGVCWVGGRNPVTQIQFETLKRNGVTWISQTPFGWQRGVSDPVIEFEKVGARIMWGESAEGLRVTTELANSNGVEVLLKPHLWARNGWPGDIRMQNETEWEVWFGHYREFILYYARFAEACHIPIFCIGTELHHATRYETPWRNLIGEIRKVYHGKLTYAANFHQEYEHIQFWDALDYIGIQAYFPLSARDNPGLKELVAAWKGPLLKLERLSDAYKRPVLFTEIGYKSTVDTAAEPWRWPQQSDVVKMSEECQANCYQAFFQAAWDKPWLAGVYFWKWYPHGNSRLQDIDFTPQGKPAEKVMATWFTNGKYK